MLASSLHTISEGHFNMLRARQLLVSPTTMSLKPLRESQEASLHTPAVCKDGKRSATGCPSRGRGSSLMGYPPPTTQYQKGKKRRKLTMSGASTRFNFICATQWASKLCIIPIVWYKCTTMKFNKHSTNSSSLSARCYPKSFHRLSLPPRLQMRNWGLRTLNLKPGCSGIPEHRPLTLAMCPPDRAVCFKIILLLAEHSLFPQELNNWVVKSVVSNPGFQIPAFFKKKNGGPFLFQYYKMSNRKPYIYPYMLQRQTEKASFFVSGQNHISSFWLCTWLCFFHFILLW